MNKITMQEFANTFDVYVAKEKNGDVYSFDEKPRLYSDITWICSGVYKAIFVTDFISDTEEHDYTVLVSPQVKELSKTAVSTPNTEREDAQIEVLKDIYYTLNNMYNKLCKN